MKSYDINISEVITIPKITVEIGGDFGELVTNPKNIHLVGKRIKPGIEITDEAIREAETNPDLLCTAITCDECLTSFKMLTRDDSNILSDCLLLADAISKRIKTNYEPRFLMRKVSEIVLNSVMFNRKD